MPAKTQPSVSKDSAIPTITELSLLWFQFTNSTGATLAIVSEGSEEVRGVGERATVGIFGWGVAKQDLP